VIWAVQQVIEGIKWLNDHPPQSFLGSADTHTATGSRRATGGPVMPGASYLVGESGPETLVMGAMGGYVLPSSGGSVVGGVHLHIHIDQGAYIDGPAIDVLTNRIASRLRYTPAT
jgi:hypothetical protein